MNRIKIAASILMASVWQLTFAQTAPPADLVTIEQNFKKLDVLGSVLYVAAHPDDENTRLLAYLAQEKHYRTGYLSLTRGDGGQIRAIYYPNTAARAKDFCATTHSLIFSKFVRDYC